jgi:tetratricopeptide (TPR) repeat protein
MQGYAAAETEQAFARARVLCDALPVSPQLYPVLRGLISYHQVRAELAAAHTLSEQLLGLAAERPADDALRVQAHYGYATTVFSIGRLDPSRSHLEAALAAYDPATHRQHIVVYGGYDPGVACSIWLAWTRTLQGAVDDAQPLCADALELARRHGDAFSLAWAHCGIGVLYQLFGDAAASETASAEAVRLAEEHGFPYVLGMATINRAWALIMQGKSPTGITMLRDGVALVERTGAALVRPTYLAMLAAADVLEGDRKSALARFDAAFAEMARTGERLHEAALLIVKSRLLAAGGDGRSSRAEATEAEDCLRLALDVARAQQARLFELRAAVALGRHWCERGRTDEARELLSSAHAWFEHHRAATPEIAAARELLAELSE